MTCEHGCCPREVLDLFCGAGGAAMGLHRAWPHTRIVGVDIKRQPHYPFSFVQDDAMTHPLEGYDFIWASPPCQRYSSLNGMMWLRYQKEYPDLVPATIARLRRTDAEWVTENVEGAPIGHPFMLCGSMFGLGVDGFQLRRHRRFEASRLLLAPPCAHTGPTIGVYGQHGRDRRRTAKTFFSVPECRLAMGIDWMTGDELSQAVPPAYSEYIAHQLTPALQEQAA